MRRTRKAKLPPTATLLKGLDGRTPTSARSPMPLQLSWTRRNNSERWLHASLPTEDTLLLSTWVLRGLDGSHPARTRFSLVATYRTSHLDTGVSSLQTQGWTCSMRITCKVRATLWLTFQAMRSTWKHIAWVMSTPTS